MKIRNKIKIRMNNASWAINYLFTSRLCQQCNYAISFALNYLSPADYGNYAINFAFNYLSTSWLWQLCTFYCAPYLAHSRLLQVGSKAFEIFNSFYFFPSTHLAAENALLQVKTGIISADDILIVRKIDGRGGADGARIRLVEIDKSQLDVDVANCKSKL